MAEQGERAERTMTTAMLKVFANPLRRDMMRIFARKEYLRAADIAEALGEPANKISFHLRVMADAGLIIEAPEQARDGRDRVWTPIKEALNIGGPSSSDEDIALSNTVIAAIAEDHAVLMQRVVAYSIATVAEEGSGSHGTLMVNNLRLTATEFTALMDRLQQEIRDAERNHDRSAPDGVAWQLDIVAADETI